MLSKDNTGQQNWVNGGQDGVGGWGGAEIPKYLSDVRIFTIKVTIIDAQAA